MLNYWTFFSFQACRKGSFGDQCNLICGHCRNVNQCSHINGTCLAGCGAGYQGDLCKTRKSYAQQRIKLRSFSTTQKKLCELYMHHHSIYQSIHFNKLQFSWKYLSSLIDINRNCETIISKFHNLYCTLIWRTLTV